ncbi:MAG TPA: hypothetical protein VGS19_17750, partial [Streptosporangiaceae bacterium]|nr:hypothetical protein [Streptosporangiaceae bacterium]
GVQVRDDRDDVAALTDSVIRCWNKPHGSFSFQTTEPPQGEVLFELLRIAFLASLTRDEQRSTRFSIIFGSESECVKMAPVFLEFENAPKSIWLTEPKPYDPGQIRRLAPATDPARVFIGVEVGPGGAGLGIWGLLDIGGSWSGFLRHERDAGFVPPDLLAVSSSKPGQLTVSRGGWVIAVLRQGRQTDGSASSPLEHGPVADFFKPSQIACYAEVCSRLNCDRYGDGNDDFPARSYRHVIERLLYRIEDQHHGGTLLLVPESAIDTSLRESAAIKYGISDDRLWVYLVMELAYHQEYFDLDAQLRDRPIVHRQDYSAVSVLGYQRDAIKYRVDDALSFAASLAAIDGAVVMSDRLAIIGYGAEITLREDDVTYIRLAEDVSGDRGDLIPIDSFGTRHRSAFRFCWRVPDSLAFVLSMDGGVRAVRRVGDDVVMWTDVLVRQPLTESFESQ